MQHLRAHRVTLEVLVLNVTNNIDILTEDTSLHVRSPHCVHIVHKSTHLEKNGPLNTLPVRAADFVWRVNFADNFTMILLRACYAFIMILV